MQWENASSFPIRFKVLVILLLVVTAAVSTITFTMAKLFHTDKSIYVHDLTSEMAMHTATETRALLAGTSRTCRCLRACSTIGSCALNTNAR